MDKLYCHDKKFSFNHFQFDCKQQILTKNGKTFPLNEKPARLLSLLLRDVETVHSKSDILEYVWPNRVITEQVVFQNISYLRTLFGQDAIKTFIKKGYQWQLPLVEVKDNSTAVDTVINKEEQQVLHAIPDVSHTSDKLNTSEITAYAPPQLKQSSLSNKMVLLFSLLLVTSMIYVLWLNSEPNTETKQGTLITLAFEHKTPHQVDVIKDSLKIHQQLNVTFAPPVVKNQSLFDSPFVTWQTLAKESNDTWVLATRLYDTDNGGVLRFHIQGVYRGWQGHIFAVSQGERVEQFNQLLTLLADSEYFSVESEQAALTKLTLLHATTNENILITHQLIEKNYQLGYLDRAAALTDTLLESEPNKVDLGLLHLLKTKIVLRNTNWQSASSNISTAFKTFDELNLPHLESLARIQQAWYEVHDNNYPQIRQSLNIAINKARKANEPLQEMLAHLIQSSLASKGHQPVLMRNELDSATKLFELHHLGEEHQIPIFYTLASATLTLEEKVSHYLSIQSRPFSPLYRDKFYYSAKFLRDTFIENKQWEEAIATIKPWQSKSFVYLSEAHIALAKQQISMGIQAAVKAFRRAQIDYDLQDALNAALLLLQHEQQGTDSDSSSEYIDYIKQNASHKWLRDNKPMLEKLSLFKGVSDF